MAVRPTQSRLLGGKSTPAMRAIFFSLTLALAVLCIHTDHAHHAAPMHNLALHTDFLNRCPYLHFPLRSFCLLLFVAIHNASARQVIRGKLNSHAIPRKDADEI